MLERLIPFIERTYRVRGEPGQRAVAGLSLGAAQTVVISANNPGMFAYIGVFSGGGMVGNPAFEAQLAELVRSRPKLYWTGAGDDDIARRRSATPLCPSSGDRLAGDASADTRRLHLACLARLPGRFHPTPVQARLSPTSKTWPQFPRPQACAVNRSSANPTLGSCAGERFSNGAEYLRTGKWRRRRDSNPRYGF